MHSIINLYTKHWAVSAEHLGISFAELKHYSTIFMACSNSTTIGAGPDLSTFYLARSRPELCSIMCATVQSRAARAATLSTLERKRSSFEAKTPHLALEGVESSLLEV